MSSNDKSFVEQAKDTLHNTKEQLAGKIGKNKEAAKEEYHHEQSKNSNNLVDKVVHKADEFGAKLDKNKEASKEQYYKNQ